MKFNDTMLASKLILESDAVPLIVGHAGIGKTTLAKRIAEKHNAHFISIDANLLKEGEIGGLPVVDEYVLKGVKRKKTTYAIHNKFLEIETLLESDSEKEIILFIDELNRCEHAVQQELMNIVLNREINGYYLPKNVKVIAAINPSDKYDEYSNSDYQVTEMDSAQEDRFVWLTLEADLKEWIEWATNLSDEESNIHSDVVEFLAENPNYFLVLNENEMIKATPRSWERVSNIYKNWLKKEDEYSSNILLQAITGNVGKKIASDFYSFIKNKSLLISPTELLSSNPLSKELLEKLEKYSHYRLYILSKNVLNYMSIHYTKNNKEKTSKVETYVEYMSHLPEDMKLAVMKLILEKFSDTLYKDFMKMPKFVDLYFNVVKLINN